jgi:hypothetical protein
MTTAYRIVGQSQLLSSTIVGVAKLSELFAFLPDGALDSTEVETFLTAAEGALVDPRSYVVFDGVPTALPAALTIQSVALKSSAVEISFGGAPPPSVNADIKVKAILHRRSDDAIEVFAPPPVRPVLADPRITFGANLRTAERYDVLVLVKGYRSFFEEDVLVP